MLRVMFTHIHNGLLDHLLRLGQRASSGSAALHQGLGESSIPEMAYALMDGTLSDNPEPRMKSDIPGQDSDSNSAQRLRLRKGKP